MRNRDVSFILKLKDTATATWNKFKGGVIKGTKNIGATFSNMGSILKAALAIGVMKKFIDAANVQEQSVAKLGAALKAVGVDSIKTRKEFEQFSSAMQQSTIYGDELVNEVQAMIIAMTGGTENTKELTKAALDLAAAHGIGAQQAARMIGQTIQGGETLGTYGVRMKDVRGEAERTAAVIERVGKRFGGMAEEMAKTSAGRMQQMQNAFGDLEEVIGESAKSIIVDLLPALQAVFPLIAKAVSVVVEGIKATVAIALTAIAAVIAPFEWVLNQLGITSSKMFQGLVTAGISEITKAGDAIVAVFSDTDGQIEEAAAATGDAAGAAFVEHTALKIAMGTPDILYRQGIMLDKIFVKWEAHTKKIKKLLDDQKASQHAVLVDVRNVSADIFAEIDAELKAWQGITLQMMAGFAAIMQNTFTAAFSGTTNAAKAFVKGILLMVLDMLQGLLLAAAADAILKGIFSFGTTLASDLAAIAGATIGVQALRAFIANMHQGGTAFINAPENREVPILVRGQETVRVTTPEQEEAQAQPVQIVVNNYSNMTATEGIKKAVEDGLRKTGVALDSFFVANPRVRAL